MCWHKWTKWEVKQATGTLTGGLFVPKEQLGQRVSETWQERRCAKCGKTQRDPLLVGM